MTEAAAIDRWKRFGRDIGPEEVASPPRFARRELLVDHVEKHPLRGRHERWHRIFAPEVLSEARDELVAEGWGPCCERLAEEYEGLVAAILLERCREGRGHTHQLTARNPSGASLREAFLEETVYAWDVETRILAIASRVIWSANPFAEGEKVAPDPVSPVERPPYRLRTGYRFHVDRSASRFRTEIRRKLDDLETFSLDRSPLWTVEHDGPDAHPATSRPTEPSHE